MIFLFYPQKKCLSFFKAFLKPFLKPFLGVFGDRYSPQWVRVVAIRKTLKVERFPVKGGEIPREGGEIPR